VAVGEGQLTPVVARVYKGSTVEQATEAYGRDAQVLAQRGYEPVGQSWQSPTTGSGAALAGILVLIVSWGIALTMPYGRSGAATFGPLLIFGGTGLGLAVIVGALAMKRPGSLTVTYRLAGVPAPAQAAATQRPAVEVEPVIRVGPAGAVVVAPATKRCPDCAEEVRAEARICRFCRYEFSAAT
jgi:hypothetical protein